MFKRLATIAAVLFSAAAIAFLARPAGATHGTPAPAPPTKPTGPPTTGAMPTP